MPTILAPCRIDYYSTKTSPRMGAVVVRGADVAIAMDLLRLRGVVVVALTSHTPALTTQQSSCTHADTML
jgi:hypothetical protein